MLTQREIDLLSDELKAAAIKAHLGHIETEEPAAYYANMSHGVELRGSFAYKPDGRWHPLFRTPATPDQQPVAWIIPGLMTMDRKHYDPAIVWSPLYTARPHWRAA
jgi:hypothetical protein